MRNAAVTSGFVTEYYLQNLIIGLCEMYFQAMMKDQFGNYVVQKVLETCDDQNRELILSRIKVHLNALKRYTYGKHIVIRVEELVTAGGKSPHLSLKFLCDLSISVNLRV